MWNTSSSASITQVANTASPGSQSTAAITTRTAHTATATARVTTLSR